MQTAKANMDFERLASSPEFKLFSIVLTKLTDIPMTLLSPEGEFRIAYGDGLRNPICRLLRASEKGLARCNACDMRHSRKAGIQGKPLLYRCHAGFLDMIIPIFVRGRHVASISSGQILTEPPSRKSFLKVKKSLPWLGLGYSAIKDDYLSTPCMTKEKAKYAMTLLETFARQLCESLSRICELESQLERGELREAKSFVASHFSNPEMGLVETASHAGLSSAHFSHLFKRETGVSFVRYVQTVRVGEAKRLLSQTDRSISEICFSCGFNSLTHFAKVFRSFERMTPSCFRKEAKS